MTPQLSFPQHRRYEDPDSTNPHPADSVLELHYSVKQIAASRGLCENAVRTALNLDFAAGFQNLLNLGRLERQLLRIANIRRPAKQSRGIHSDPFVLSCETEERLDALQFLRCLNMSRYLRSVASLSRRPVSASLRNRAVASAIVIGAACASSGSGSHDPRASASTVSFCARCQFVV